MKKDKNTKSEVKSEEAKETKSRAPKRKLEPVLSFDAYFQSLVNEGKAQNHHKAPMRQYAAKRNKLEGTVKEFKELFKQY